MKRLAVYLALHLSVLQTGVLAVQTRTEPSPSFKLSIEVDENAARKDPGLHRVLVKFTRTAVGDEVERYHEEAKGMYEMTVLRDGVPVNETPAMRELREFRKRDAYPTIKNPRLLRPGESWVTPLDVSDYYDMTRPGVYRVTVTRESDPGNLPAYNVLVSSNTVEIVVPPKSDGAVVQHVEKPKPRFGLTISPEDPDEVPPGWVVVGMQNVSQEEIRELKCWPFYGMYDFVVHRNGDPVGPTDEMRSLQAARAGVDCTGNESLLEIAPGDTYSDRVALANYFDIHEPGAYTVYAIRETYPRIPAKSVVVESNVFSFVVPQPAAAEQDHQTDASPSTPQ